MMYPSGSLFATALVPTVPPAPGRLSTTTFSPSNSLILSAITRPTIEVEPPGANGMTSVMLRFGKFWACASTGAANKPNSVAAAQSQIVQIRIFAEPPGDRRSVGGIVVERTDVRNPIQTPSFRDGPKDQTSDVQLHIGESRDSGFDAEPVIGRASARPVAIAPD